MRVLFMDKVLRLRACSFGFCYRFRMHILLDMGFSESGFRIIREAGFMRGLYRGRIRVRLGLIKG